MKVTKAIQLLPLLCILCSVSYAQVADSTAIKKKAYYEKSARKKMTKAIVFTGVGAGLFLLTMTNEQDIDDIGTNIVLIGRGSVFTLIGLGTFISAFNARSTAKKYKVGASIKNINLLNAGALQTTVYPAVSLRIDLK